nr:MAG TPA: hypothetical protein [Caudoviricetes sp.]
MIKLSKTGANPRGGFQSPYLSGSPLALATS